MRLAWFNSAFLRDQIHARQRLVVYGTFERSPYSGLQITNPQFEIVDAEQTSFDDVAATWRLPAAVWKSETVKARAPVEVSREIV